MTEQAATERIQTRKVRTKPRPDTVHAAGAQQLRDHHAAWLQAKRVADATSAEITALDKNLAKEIYDTTFWPVETLDAVPLEKLVQQARKHGFGDVVGNKMDVRAELYSRVQTEVELIRKAREKLQRLIGSELKDRRSILTRAYDETVERIAKALLIFCADEAEAIDMAKLFTPATSLHARLWDASQWTAPETAPNLAAELETPIDRIPD
ncbi:MAG: hypothetical protein ABJF10_02060 [Chthoniobacter sp.]|uniref:hypothetical protein n=1 Tax=Chthoniobacter sp. TaxID=2510640 RepID=UPI0032A88BA1